MLAHIRESIPDPLAVLLRKLDQAGTPAYLVGGSLRDLIARRTPHDWDLAVTPGAIVEPIEGLALEWMPLRVDGPSSDARHPDWTVPAATIEGDLARRDFTVNAIAFGSTVEHGALIDPHDGVADIRRRLIRSVGDPRRSMREDALRSLRAVRLVGELGWEIEAATAAAIGEHASLASTLPGPRVGNELLRLLGGDHPDRGIKSAHATGLLAVVAPAIADAWDTGIPSRLASLRGVGARLHELVRPLDERSLAALLADWAPPRAIASELRAFRRLEAAISEVTIDRAGAARLRLLARDLCGEADHALELVARRIALGHAPPDEPALLRLLLDPALRDAPVSAGELALSPLDLPVEPAGRGALLARLLLAVGSGEVANERTALLKRARLG